VLRLVEAASGSIFLDGVDIATVGIRDLRKKLAVVPQEPTLFAGTIRTNLDAEDSLDAASLWHLLRICQMEQKVKGMPAGLGLDEEIDEHSNFSVGEKQLLCVARALGKRAPLLMLDEAASALDVATEELMAAAIRMSDHNPTVLAIAHQLSTVVNADKIMVLSAGELVEFGPPRILMRASCAFTALAKAQGLLSELMSAPPEATSKTTFKTN